jgi:peptidyl-prolyl cis-trans isomerase D
MAAKAGKSLSRLFVWVILALLFVALAGFGIGSFGGGASRLGEVGETEITAQDYARALDNEIRAQIAQTQTPVNLADLRARGIDEAVLASLVARAALANEAGALGLSVGDAEVARQIRAIEGFQGVDGSFDREAYEFVLSQQGLGPREFEEDVREDTSRALLQAAVVGAIRAPEIYAESIAAFQGETRDLSILTLTEDDLADPLPAPTAEELQAYYDDNSDRFERPEARRITYAWLIPAQIMDTVEVDEDALRQLYDARIDIYRQPERRLLERLVFGSEEEAQAAFDAIEAGETDFDTLVEERDLTLDDIDLGEVAFEDLPAAAAEVIFADTESEIIGPLTSRLGPALYRVNAVLEATETSFDDARGDLREELADEAARREIAVMREEIDDLLASGATLEELAETTPMSLARSTSPPTSEDGIAGYDAFREAARAVSERDFPEVLDLSDGGLFALRLDEVVPPAVPPLAEIEEEVAAAWRVTALRAALTPGPISWWARSRPVQRWRTSATSRPKPGSGGRISSPTCRPRSWCRPSSWAMRAMSWPSPARPRPISCGSTRLTRRPATRGHRAAPADPGADRRAIHGAGHLRKLWPRAAGRCGHPPRPERDQRRPRTVPVSRAHGPDPRFRGIRGRLGRGQEPAGLRPAGRRSRHAGLGDAEADGCGPRRLHP